MVCTAAVKEGSYLCSKHQMEWRKDKAQGATISFSEWVEDYERATKCNRCLEHPKLDGDYLCEKCRYG